MEEKYSKEKGIKTYKGKEGLEALEEIFSFSSNQEVFNINPRKKTKKILEKIKRS